MLLGNRLLGKKAAAVLVHVPIRSILQSDGHQDRNLIRNLLLLTLYVWRFKPVPRPRELEDMLQKRLKCYCE